MTNPDNTDRVNPKIKITANVDKVYQETTAGNSKPEGHFREIVEKSVNTSPSTTYSAKRKR
jgi:hypothetical protein